MARHTRLVLCRLWKGFTTEQRYSSIDAWNDQISTVFGGLVGEPRERDGFSASLA
jgi:hypothetical protein